MRRLLLLNSYEKIITTNQPQQEFKSPQKQSAETPIIRNYLIGSVVTLRTRDYFY